MYIHVIGPRQSGKSTLAAVLAEELGLPWHDCGRALKADLGAILGAGSTAVAFQDKDHIRPMLIALADCYRAIEADACLRPRRVDNGVGGCTADGVIISGARTRLELTAFIKNHGGEQYIIELRQPGNPWKPPDNFELAGVYDWFKHPFVKDSFLLINETGLAGLQAAARDIARQLKHPLERLRKLARDAGAEACTGEGRR